MMMSQAPPMMSKCAKCGEAVEVAELEIHIKEELLYYPYRCHICKMRFLTESQLRNTHFPRKHPESQVQILANENERLEAEVAEIMKHSMSPTVPQTVRPYRSLPMTNPYPTTPGSHQNTFYPLIPRMFTVPKSEPREADVISLEPLSDSVDNSDTPQRAKRTRKSRPAEKTVTETPENIVESEKASYTGRRRGPKPKGWDEGQSQEEEAPHLEPEPTPVTESPKLEVMEGNAENRKQDESSEIPAEEVPKKKRKLVCPDENPLLSDGTKAYHRFSRKVQSLIRKRIKESNVAERCGKCDFEYKPEHTNLYSAIENHLLTHISDKAYACPICGHTTNVIERHFRVYHAPDDIVPRSQLDMRPEIVEEAIDNIFDCFPDLRWIRELSKEDIGKTRQYRRQPPEIKRGRPPKSAKKDVVKVPRLKTPMVSYDENIAPEFAKAIESVRRGLREQQLDDPVEIRCQLEGCKFALRTVTGVHIERHIVAHYNQPLYECSECGEETKYLYHHTLSKHKEEREEVMRCSKNFKGLHEQDLLDLLKSAFPLKATPADSNVEEKNAEDVPNDEKSVAEDVPSI